MFKQVKVLLQPIYILVLLSIFLIWFGIPNVEKFLKDESIVVLHKEYLPRPVPAPMIKICHYSETGVGWKGLKDVWSNFYRAVCEEVKEEDIEDCIHNNTWSLSESVFSFSPIRYYSIHHPDSSMMFS